MTDGPLRFARYAFPPNALGYCGPDESESLLELASEPHEEDELRHLAAEFGGAWPYLELIASATGTPDPLDASVVEAYWIGNDLLARVPMEQMGRAIEERFRKSTGSSWPRLAESVPAGAVPHHSYHVFAVYPWLDLLRSGNHAEPLHVLDRCRIRSGVVAAVSGDVVQVHSRALAWDGRTLSLGQAMVEEVTLASSGRTLAGRVARGDHVAMHWDWVCERISRADAARLERWNRRQMDMVNALSKPGTVDVLG